jgi:hypothetical protein
MEGEADCGLEIRVHACGFVVCTSLQLPALTVIFTRLPGSTGRALSLNVRPSTVNV